MFVKGLTIRGRLIFATVAAGLLFFLLAGLSYWSQYKAGQAFESVLDGAVAPWIAVSDINAGLNEVRFHMAAYVMGGMSNNGALAKLREIRVSLPAVWRSFRSGFDPTTASPIELDAIDSIDQAFKELPPILEALELAYVHEDKTAVGTILNDQWPFIVKLISRPLSELLVPARVAYMNATVAQNRAEGHRLVMLAILGNLMGLIILAGIMIPLVRSISRSVNDMCVILAKVSEGDLSVHPDTQRSDELGDMSRSLESTMESLRELDLARHELMQSEKMASLGRLVAGFAHEINTPIGVSISGNSVAKSKLNELQRLIERDEVDERELHDVLAGINEGITLTEGNLNKAAELVRSFKRTSVDQSSDILRDFDLAECISDVISSLHNKFKRSPIKIDVTCKTASRAYGSPGAIGQLLTNLLENSYLHAFSNGTQAGYIRIDVHVIQDQIHIHYVDDGVGMTEEVRGKVFEPFFTTNRADGGSGLGLYIAYNLVTTRLHGSINCQSTPGQGTCFDISFPLMAKSDLKKPA